MPDSTHTDNPTPTEPYREREQYAALCAHRGSRPVASRHDKHQALVPEPTRTDSSEGNTSFGEDLGTGP